MKDAVTDYFEIQQLRGNPDNPLDLMWLAVPVARDLKNLSSFAYMNARLVELRSTYPHRIYRMISIRLVDDPLIK